jgi:hypothetical protein
MHCVVMPGCYRGRILNDNGCLVLHRFATLADTPINVILRNIYGETENDFLIVQVSGDGCHLVESEWTKRLNPQVLAGLAISHSIPAFLGTLTLDLLERTTMTVS